MLTNDQTAQIKKQIIQQIEKSFPDDKKEFAKQQIETMNSEQLGTFLEQNKLIKTSPEAEPQGCVFCSIASGHIESHKIDENSKAIAVLEINPVSKGHILVIPKEHITSSDKVPASVFSLAKRVEKRIKTKFKPKKITTNSSNLFGHEIINIIPIYGEEESKERSQASPEELIYLQDVLSQPEKIIIKKSKAPKKLKLKKLGKKLWLPKRIP